jgi:hypothetical protein
VLDATERNPPEKIGRPENVGFPENAGEPVNVPESAPPASDALLIEADTNVALAAYRLVDDASVAKKFVVVAFARSVFPCTDNAPITV